MAMGESIWIVCSFHYYLGNHHSLEIRRSVASEGEAWDTLSDVDKRKTRPRSSGRMEGGQSVVREKIGSCEKGLIYEFGVCPRLYPKP